MGKKTNVTDKSTQSGSIPWVILNIFRKLEFIDSLWDALNQLQGLLNAPCALLGPRRVFYKFLWLGLWYK